MFNKMVSKSLRKPGFFFKRKISKLFEANLALYEEHEQYINFLTIENAFEIGYGPGHGIKKYCSKYKINIEGIDFSNAMFSEATKRNLDYIQEGRVKLYLGDFTAYLPDNKKYDLIYLFNVIYFWNDPEAALNKIIHLLNANGKISIFMDGADVLRNNKSIDKSVFHIHTTEYIMALLKKVGFNDIIERKSSKFTGSSFIIGNKLLPSSNSTGSQRGRSC